MVFRFSYSGQQDDPWAVHGCPLCSFVWDVFLQRYLCLLVLLALVLFFQSCRRRLGQVVWQRVCPLGAVSIIRPQNCHFLIRAFLDYFFFGLDVLSKS